jgi:murein DD-endopeptidase MepM/ murein hydrolase activator NlpD
MGHRPVLGFWYRAQKADTLSLLAQRHRVHLTDLEELNGLDHRDPLEPGREVFIPRVSMRRKAGQRSGVASMPPRGSSKRSVTPEAGPLPRLIFPVPGGAISSPFGQRNGRPHEGIDIAAPEGTKVLAAAAGVVIYAGSGVRGYGNLVILRHAHGFVSVYAHNRRNLATQGQKLPQGAVIAEVGHTGRATADHLHFELRHGDVPRDPHPLLAKVAERPTNALR